MNARQQFYPYVRGLADRLGLRDWVFEISRGQPPTDSDGVTPNAAIFCAYGRKHAEIRLSDAFLEDFTPEEQRQTLCHELIHALFAPMHQYLNDQLEQSTFKGYVMLMEYGVDAVADAIAPRMPLPGEFLD